MKRAALLFAVALLLIAHPRPARAEDATTLTGQFLWSHRNRGGDLEAVFTPTGEATWSVDFHFEFRNQPHTYSGTAEGSLSDGALRGQVHNEGKGRTFTFSGSFKDGKFSGTHAEIEGKRTQQTGTLMLSR